MATRTVTGKATKWKWLETAKGNPFLKVRFAIKGTGEVLDGELHFTEAALPRSLESLAHMGWVGTKVGEILPGVGGLDRNEVELVVERGTWTGRDGVERDDNEEKIKWINALGGKFGTKAAQPEKAELDVNRVRSFSDSIEERVRSIQANAGRPVPPASRVSAQPAPAAKRPANEWDNDPGIGDDADIPF